MLGLVIYEALDLLYYSGKVAYNCMSIGYNSLKSTNKNTDKEINTEDYKKRIQYLEERLEKLEKQTEKE